ncbi:MAG: hypothetical protein MdMp014T_0661 [Treponematales bacterium]
MPLMGKEQNSVSVRTIRRKINGIYEGPVSHPDILKGFGDVNPAYPDKIMRMTKESNAAIIKNMNCTSLSGLLGQVFSFVLGQPD